MILKFYYRFSRPFARRIYIFFLVFLFGLHCCEGWKKSIEILAFFIVVAFFKMFFLLPIQIFVYFVCIMYLMHTLTSINDMLYCENFANAVYSV